MANERDKRGRYNTKQIDFSAKSLGKIKRTPTSAQPKQGKEDNVKSNRKSSSINAKPLNQDTKRADTTKKSAKSPRKTKDNTAKRKAGNSSPNGGIKRDELRVVEGGKSPKRMISRLIIAVICLAIVLSAVLFCVTRPTGIGEWLKTAFASGENANGFPISLSDCTAESIYSSNGRLYVLCESEIRCYDKNGGLLFSRVPGFSNAAVRVSDMRILTFDRGGTQYRIDSVSNEIVAKSTENKLIDCAIADNGSYALGTLSETEAGTVTVYNSSNHEIYKFHSADKQILHIAISPNGKNIGVCSLSIEDSKTVSTVSLYSIKSEKAVAVKQFSGQTVYAMQFANNSTLCGITNDEWFAIDNNGQKTVGFESQSPMKYQFTDNGNTLISLAGASNSVKNSVVVINARGDKIAEFEVDSTVDSISADKSNIYVQSSVLDAYSYEGEKLVSSEINPGAICVRAAFGKAAVLYSAGIELY